MAQEIVPLNSAVVGQVAQLWFMGSAFQEMLLCG